MAVIQKAQSVNIKRQFVKAIIIPLTLYLIFCFLPFAFSQDDYSNLDPAVKKLISKYHLTKAKVAIKAISLTDNTVLYERNAGMPLKPASNLKLFTTGAALCLLGPDFNYQTILYRSGVITDRVLTGNLIVTSNGNPNISGRFYDGNPTAVFEDWGDVLRTMGINKITGDIIIDDTAFDRDYLIESWPQDQLWCWYCAPVSAVSFNDNCIDITVYPSKKTSKVLHRLEPDTDYINIINNCKQTSRKTLHAIGFYRMPDANTIAIKGRCYQDSGGYKESVTVDTPPLYFGTVLKETLICKKGITIAGEIRLATKTYNTQADKLIKIASVKTDLLTTLEVTNKNSQNFYAEQVLKTLGYHFEGKGTFKNGLAQIEKFLKDNKIIPDGQEFTQVDGSGLSPQNQVTVDEIANLLVYLHRHKYGEQFRETLPQNGVDGTLKKRLNGNGKSHKIWAKTGYINGVSSLSGYIINNNNIAFSIVINGVVDVSNARQFQEKVLDLLMKY